MLSAQRIKQLAREVGFHDCGIAKARPLHDFSLQLDDWLAGGHAGTMDYLRRNAEKRTDPAQLLPGAQSVVSLLLSYKPTQTLSQPPLLARYAYGEDYHTRIRPMLRQLAEHMLAEQPNQDTKLCIDTVPISDKLWAREAGLGWIGRNTLLVHPLYGSFCHLAEIVTTAQFDLYDTPIEPRCGNCKLCVEACPHTALMQAPHGTYLDAPRCRSYQTIESVQAPAGASDGGKHDPASDYLFGCDLCQLACPYNSQSPTMRTITDDDLVLARRLTSAHGDEFVRLAQSTALSRVRYKNE